MEWGGISIYFLNLIYELSPPMMEAIKYVPFLRLLVPFVLGIGISMYAGINLWDSLKLYILIPIFILLAIFVKISAEWSVRWLFGCVCFLFFTLAGIGLTNHHQRVSGIESNVPVDALVVLLQAPEPRSNTHRAVSKVICFRGEGEPWRMVNQKVMLYFRSTDSLASGLGYGSILAMRTRFNPTPGADNPYQFNYAKYLASKSIFQTGFVSPGGWLEVDWEGSKLVAYSFKLRERLLGLFRKANLEGNNLGVASALTMGYSNLLDHETRRVYSASGAIHILAVSGQHVGILFIVISSMLFFMGRKPVARGLKAALIILFLWFYALFTGLSPSVLRATLMFSFIVIGNALSRKSNIYNTMCASAFFLLCFDPLLIIDIGFQLSYLAVLSIVYFYPYIYRLIFVPNRWIDKVWSLVAVSIAAQIGTFGLSLYYFQQFPNYFLLTNLYAIPLATIIIYLSVVLILISPLWAVGQWVGIALNGCLTALNSLTRFTEALPHSTASGITLSILELVLILVAILILSMYLYSRRGYLLASALGAISIFLICRQSIGSESKDYPQMVVFSLRGHTAIGFAHGQSMVLFHSDSTSVDPFKAHSFSLQGYITRMGIKNPLHFCELPGKHISQLPKLTATPSPFGNWYCFSGLTLFQPVGSALSNYQVDKPLDIDFLIISNRLRQRPDRLLSVVNPKLVIVDSSVPAFRARQLAAIIGSLGYRVHVVGEQGAFVWGGGEPQNL